MLVAVRCALRYKSHNRIEIMFGRLKDGRRGATRYDRCPKIFLSAIAIAAIVIYWLWVLTLAICVTKPGIHAIDRTLSSGAAQRHVDLYGTSIFAC